MALSGVGSKGGRHEVGLVTVTPQTRHGVKAPPVKFSRRYSVVLCRTICELS